MNREEQKKHFEAIYQTLNDEQKLAVNQIFGPVLVVAGPGTGKTQILSARIGKILLDTDYLPDNILCLTYTDAGRVAMRKRLQSMIGAEAYRIHIHTFHSFCNQIIQENTRLFERNSLDPVSDLERMAFIREVIDGFGKENPLRRYRSDVYFEIGRLQMLYSVMKKEGWSSALVRSCAEAYIRELPEREEFRYKKNGKNYKAGDLKKKDYDEVVEKMQLLIHAAESFDVFQDIMRRHHRYDFDDMINWVIEALEKNDALRYDCYERYQFILVDEFQDTSGTQNRLVQLLCGDETEPNLFVVGDADQSIYRFQGANVENLIRYRDQYADLLYQVVLKSNYRSTQAILDLSSALIKQNNTRWVSGQGEMAQTLVAAHPARQASAVVPRLRVYENPFQEMAGITREIEELLQQGAEPGSIAVLYRENKWGDALIKFFKAKSIPFYSRRKEDLFTIPLASRMLRVLRYIACESAIPFSAGDLLFEILHFNEFRIPPAEIAKVNIWFNESAHGRKSGLRQYLHENQSKTKTSLFDAGPSPALLEAARLLEKWIADSHNLPVIGLAELIMREGGFLETALQEEDEKIWNLEVLRTWMDFIKDEMHRHPLYTLAQLISVIDLMQAEELSIPLYRVSGNAEGVNLLTIHGSKGLEFRYVFLMNCVRSVWEGKSSPNRNYALPPGLIQQKQQESKQQQTEELRRLFFVGITRAEEHLQISWTQMDEKEKAMEPSGFVAELNEEKQYPEERVQMSKDDLLPFLIIYLEKDKRPRIAEAEKEWLQPIIDRFEMNATALNNYLNCPLKFYYQNIIRVPSGRNENMEFGSAVHFALQRLFEKMLEQQGIFPELHVLLDDFGFYMKR
ncbi:MAG TPA: ATP-dependent DNA helicase, partial [Chitinophagaceae bacterium]|nr:ATP-dependent DNA helicase [Chitinophagaceae bacterium]